MPKIQGNFANGDQLPDRDYVDGDASGPGLNQVLDKTNAAPHVFATVAEAESAEYSEPETVAVIETAQFYVYDSSSALTRDGFWVLNTVGAGRLVSILLDYALLAGRSGGQTLYGSAITGEDLALHSNTSKNGSVNIASFADFDESLKALKILRDTTSFGTIDDASLALKSEQVSTAGSKITLALGQSSIYEVYGGAIEFEVEDSYSRGKLNFYTKNATVNAPNVLALTLSMDGEAGFGGITAPTARIHSKGSTSDSSAYALKVDDSSDSSLLSVRNDGLRYHKGGIARPALTITTDTTLTTATQAFLLFDFPLTGGVVTLPSSPEDGQEFHPENKGSFAVTLARNGKLINGLASNVAIGSQSNGFYKFDAQSGSWWNFN